VAIIGTQWAFAAVTFALIFEPENKWEGHHPFPTSSVTYRVLFAVMLGLLGVTDAASWLATSLPALHEMRLQRKLGRLIDIE
jgi:hypothetical protein